MVSQASSVLKRNAIANYLGQIYTISVGIIIYPFYLRYLGAEAYGLIGFFVVLQAWLGVFEMGMAPALERHVAYIRAKKNDLFDLRKILRSLESILLLMALIVCVAVYFFRYWISEHWLNVQELALAEVSYCIFLMAVINSIRWCVSLYKSGLSGMERQVWLNVANVSFASLRFLGALLVLKFVDSSPSAFFEYQLVIMLAEFAVLRVKIFKILPSIKRLGFIYFSRSSLSDIFPFAFGVAYSSMIVIAVMQFDKLILSKTLSLREYGYFTLVAIVSTGIMQLGSPLGKALLPRMTYMLAEKNEAKVIELYRNASQLIALLMFSVAVTIAFFSKELIYVWTGDIAASAWAESILVWYVIANAFIPILMMQYYLQYAHGRLKWHIIMNTVLAAVSVPVIYVIATRYSALEVGVAWFVIQASLFIIWPAIVHKKFAPGIHLNWLAFDIFPILFLSIVAGFLSSMIPVDINQMSRLAGLFVLGLIGLFVLLVSSMGSSVVRKRIRHRR